MKNTLYKLKKHRGFTAIELMIVVVIIGIIVSIGVANYIASSKKRALEASLMTNMRTLQIMLETYKVDWQLYPDSLANLGLEATSRRYNKSIANPYTRQSGPVGTTNLWAIDYLDPSDPTFPTNKALYFGRVGYQPIGTAPSISKYYLFGYGDNSIPIERKGTTYTVTNGG